jgi:hypothetical protein
MKKFQGSSLEASNPKPPMKGITWGLMAGLAGTITMDLAMASGLSILGLPLDTCYRTIGSTVMRFFYLLGMQLGGEFTLGVAAYHLIGPLLGASYGLIVSQVSVLQRTTLKETLLYAVLYAEIVSQLILAMVPVLLSMPAQEAALWFAGSSILHAIWGVVMGFAMYYGPRMETRNYRNTKKGTGEILWKTSSAGKTMQLRGASITQQHYTT